MKTSLPSPDSRRRFLRTAGMGAMAAGLCPRAALGGESNRRKPNVVILLIDDLGYGDLGCFGNERIPTPHIDSLARRGIKCTMSYITNPPCSPSRCCLMTGMYAQRFGKSGMARGMPIPQDHPTMAEYLRDAGYVTGQIGKWDIGATGQGPHQRGFAEVAMWAPGDYYDCRREDGTPVYRTDLDAEYAVEFVERNRKNPFFLYFSPLAIHSPLRQTPQHYRDRVKGGNGTAYEGAVAAIDEAVGKLISVLKKHGLENDTLILLTGDNGANLNEGGSSAPYRGGKFRGHTLFEGWVHTPTIISWPGALPKGTTYDGLMCTMDFYATAAAVAGSPLPSRCEGKNLLPYMKGRLSGDVHEYLFWNNADPTDNPHRNLYAVRWKDWRLVRHPDGWRLFDLRKDPRETIDLGPDFPNIRHHLIEKHAAFVATLPPPGHSADYDPANSGNVPEGWGWVIQAG